MKFLSNMTNLDMIEDGSGKVSFTPTERTKLSGIATAATNDNSKWGAIDRCGFISTDVEFLFDENTATLTLDASGYQDSWSYFRNGSNCVVSGTKSIVLPASGASAGMYFIYITDASGNLQASTSVWDLTNANIIPVVIIIWNPANTPKYILCKENHTCLIDRRMHLYEHVTAGTKLISGGYINASSYTLSTYSDAANTYSIDAATIYDEDLIFNHETLADSDGTTLNYSIMRRDGSGWTWARSEVPFWYDGTSIRVDNDTSSGATPTNNKYMNAYLIITNASGDFRYTFINGRTGSYNTLALAQAEDYASFDMTGFPFAEFVWAARITYLYNSGQSNKGKCQLATAPQRLSSSQSSINVAVSANHNGLAGIQGGAINEYYHLTSTEYTNATIAGAPGDATVRTLGSGSGDAAFGDHLHSEYAASGHTQAESTITFTDIASGNVSTSAHGFAPKATAPAGIAINALGIASGETTFSNKTIFSGLTKISVGTGTPSTPSVGDLWIDTN